MRKRAIKLIKEKKVKIITSTDKLIIAYVGDKIVTLKKKLGRREISCSCQNHARFVNINPLCSHKLAFYFVWMLQGIKDGD